MYIPSKYNCYFIFSFIVCMFTSLNIRQAKHHKRAICNLADPLAILLLAVLQNVRLITSICILMYNCLDQYTQISISLYFCALKLFLSNSKVMGFRSRNVISGIYRGINQFFFKAFCG
jgi:hypothetical protein